MLSVHSFNKYVLPSKRKAQIAGGKVSVIMVDRAREDVMSCLSTSPFSLSSL